MKNAAKGLSTASPTSQKDDEHDWEAHDMHSTLMRAEEIKGDAAKMDRIKKIAGAKAKAATAINSLADIKLARKRVRKEAMMAKVKDMDGDGV